MADSASVPQVEAMSLDAPNPGAAGLLSARASGFPASLWQGSDPEVLRSLFRAVEPPVPALRGLMHSLVLAEAEPPAGGADGVAHLAARLDWLLDNGAVEQAEALLDIVGREDPELFRRWADLNLLLGRSEAPCQALEAQPGLSIDMGLRVFCIARSGDWSRASLVLSTAISLGQLPVRRADLLERFLDPDLAESRRPLIPPVRPTPLEFRLYEALGETLPTAPLPLPYAVLDIGGDNGWRAQLESAERLARVGSLPANVLLGLYTRQRAAASGGVWDRVRALQALEAALPRAAPGVVGPSLTEVWPQMANAGLLVPFAELFAEPLSQVALQGRAARMASRAAFLSPDYESLALRMTDTRPETLFLTAIARGQSPAQMVDLPHSESVAMVWTNAPASEVLTQQLANGRLGEVILRAIALTASGASGNGGDLTEGLATLRQLGLEDVARRAALQLMLLDAERARR